mmetsp:Transcript_25310/g.64300  ORF Transcript_25310/g.64300 Transcript_25310/m.64300 type:complete len:314 (+) Transcript_25310:93-1034(+)
MSGVAIVGSTMIEHFTYLKRAPGPGETVVGDRTAIGYGGKGANQAVMARNLGSRVAMVNCLGDDAHGNIYREKLQAMGVDTTHMHTAKGMASGAAPIWVEADGTNRIIVVPGANNELTPGQAVAAVDALKASVVVGQFEILQNVTAAAFAEAKKQGAITVLNPAPASTVDPSLLASSDWIIPNESEFVLLATGAPPSDGGLPSDEAILGYATHLRSQSLSTRLLVTLGAAGVALVSREGDQVTRLTPPTTTDVVDTTGAGDAFVGAFAHGLASGLSEEDACKLGMACASDSVRREGTQVAFPTHERCQALGLI